MELDNFPLRVIIAGYNRQIPIEYVFKGVDMLRHELETKGCELLVDDVKRVIVDFNNDIINDFESSLSPDYDKLSNDGEQFLKSLNLCKSYKSIYDRDNDNTIDDDNLFINRKLYMNGFFDEDSFVSNIPLTNIARRFSKKGKSVTKIVRIPNLSRIQQNINNHTLTTQYKPVQYMKRGNCGVSGGVNALINGGGSGGISPMNSGGVNTLMNGGNINVNSLVSGGNVGVNPLMSGGNVGVNPSLNGSRVNNYGHNNDYRDTNIKIQEDNNNNLVSNEYRKYNNFNSGADLHNMDNFNPRRDYNKEWGKKPNDDQRYIYKNNDYNRRYNNITRDYNNINLNNSPKRDDNDYNNKYTFNDETKNYNKNLEQNGDNLHHTQQLQDGKLGLKRNWNKYIMDDNNQKHHQEDDTSKIQSNNLDLTNNTKSPGLSYPKSIIKKDNQNKFNIPIKYTDLITSDVNEEMISLVLEMKLDQCNNKVTENDIVGLTDIKKLIKDKIVQPILRPHLHIGLFKAPKGILLFGPPGTGKTTIAKWIAHVSKATFFEISPSSITSKFHGETESIIKTLFKVAEFDSPSLIFIDEVDAILGKRRSNDDDSSIRMKNQLLQMMDGLNNKEDSVVVVAAATNRPDMLDDAALRRFTKRVLVPLPDLDTRKKFIYDILNKNTSSKCQLSESDLDYIANVTHGWSGCDLLTLCSKAAEYSYDDTIMQYGGIENVPDINVFRSIVLEDFNKAITFVHPSSNWDTFEFFKEWDKKHGSH